MNRTISPVLMLGFAAAISLNTNSCTTSASLRTASANPAEMSGTYTVFLFGARSSNDIERVAILAKEESPYSFKIDSPDFNYKTITAMPSDKTSKEQLNLSASTALSMTLSQARSSTATGPLSDMK